MKIKHSRFPALSLAAVAMLAILNAHTSTAFAQGSLTPPGAPGATMKSLAQIEPRTPISSAPFTISTPGSYYLTANLTVSGGDAIIIATNGVTLDLNGFTISSTGASMTGGGVAFNGGWRNITIANGFIQGGVTNNGSGAYSGSGFGYGIYNSGSPPANVLVSRVSVSGCRFHGIQLAYADSTVVENCTVRTVGSDGISASIIKSCSAMDCGLMAIYGYEVSDSRGQSSSDYGLYARTAQNCYGASRSGYGLYAITALNCYGYSYGSSYGLYASGTATGCYGYSYTGTGLYAFIANVCHGETGSGTALSTHHNVNSY